MTERTPDAVLALISGFDVLHNAAFSPRAGATFCNGYLTCLTAAMGCPVPPLVANQQVEWLASNEGKMNAWQEINASFALERANLGYPVVAGLIEQPHGHVAVVVPSPVADPTRLYVSAAGHECFLRAPIERSFGLNHSLSFFCHP